MTWKIVAGIFAVIALALGVPAWRHFQETPPPAAPIMRAQLPARTGVTFGSGTDPLDAAISPDEQQIAIVATRDGVSALWLQSLSTGDLQMLAGTEGAALPAWDRDGRRLAFFAQGKLQILDVGSRSISPVAGTPTPRGVAWRDDALVFAGGAGIIESVSDGQVAAVTTLSDGDRAHEYPFIDDGGRLVYIAVRNDGARVVRVQSPTGGDQSAAAVELTQTSGHAELRDGFLVHVRDNVLLAQRLDDEGTALIGRSLAMATGVGTSDTGHAYFASSRRLALWAAAVSRKSELSWFDANGRRIASAAEPGDYWQVRLSPDERDAAVTVVDPLLRTLDVFVIPLASPGTTRRVSLGIGPESDPVWSPDGATLLYRALQGGRGIVMSRPASPSSAPEQPMFSKDGLDVTPSDWRAASILAHAQSAGRTRVVTTIDARSKADTTLTAQGFNSWDARISPDGRWVAYTADESGSPEVYVQAWPPSSTRVRATFGGGQRAQWASAGTIYFRRGDQIMRTELTAGDTPVVSVPQQVLAAPGLRDFVVSRLTNRLLVVAAAAATGEATAHLVFDWQGEVPPPPQPVPKL